MIRSMFTAISSLQLHQYYMDVVADNLANANTTGFKSSRFSFQDQFSQVMSSGAAPSDEKGGVNPVQIGLGTRVGTVSPSFTQGSLQSTGRNTDMAIQGEGFFIYANGGANFYSRDGMLNMDSEGYLVNSSTGYRLQGWQATSGSIADGQALSDLQLPLGSTMARATANATVGGNLDSRLATDATYNSTMGVYDSLGNLRSISIVFTHTGDDAWSWEASMDGNTLGNGDLTFTTDGQYDTGSPGTITIPAANGAAESTVTLDFTNVTQLATSGDVSVLSQDGLAAGDLTSFYVSSDDGKVYGLYSNGMEQLVGQLAFAKFVNPAGLERIGQNMFRQGLNSGEPAVGTANTGGRGVVASGYLETSNVDMAQEFTNMILAQRGFQASSRVITTSDEMLQELVNLKR
jgi:flagellar hook protein FlgE